MAVPDTQIRTTPRAVPRERPSADGPPLQAHSKWHEPSYQAFVVLRVAFVALPLAMGIDKYFNSMVYWPQYLAGWINNIIPGTAQEMMYAVGAVEILAGILVALKPRYAAYVVTAWLLGIVINLYSAGTGYYDVGARDLVLMAAAFVLATLARKWDPPLAFERRFHRGE
ncbi:MAG TPA: DoxX family protein [Gaiellaceae bacterium]|nr:DoxX family protein [Gaiellaceae bacterium]